MNEYPLGVYASTLLGEKYMQDLVKFSIEGMHCGGCVRRVTSALQQVKGVELRSVEVGSAQMSFDPETTNVGEIAAAVNSIGFSARLQK
jgi:copper chaperone